MYERAPYKTVDGKALFLLGVSGGKSKMTGVLKFVNMAFLGKMLFIISFIMMVFSAPSFANGMIGNKAEGFVGGAIKQYAAAGAEVEVNVGSIVADSSRNNTVYGYVGGDINMNNTNSSLVLNVGSIHSDRKGR